MNFPTRHPLNQGGGAIPSADLILALEPHDIGGNTHTMIDQLHRSSRTNTKSGVKLVTIAANDLYTKGNYQNFQRFQDVDLAIAADAEATLPSLIEEVKRLITPDRKRFFQDRGGKLAAMHQRAEERTRQEAAVVWNLSPLSHARVAYEQRLLISRFISPALNFGPISDSDGSEHRGQLVCYERNIREHRCTHSPGAAMQPSRALCGLACYCPLSSGMLLGSGEGGTDFRNA